ncbi:MAG: serine hydrolase domain-containing protein [Microthrixaceae bacterium]
MRRLGPIVAATVVVFAGCSGPERPVADEGPTTAVDVNTTTTAPEASEVSFGIPAELLQRVQDAGHPFPDIEYPSQPEGVPWPTDEWPEGEIPDGVDAAALEAAIDEAFSGGLGNADVIDAVLVVKDGKLVVEEYNDWNPEELHNSWSMAKSVTSSLVGILAGRGEFDVFQPATAPEWADQADPRHAITVDSLLRMSSGLQWTEDYNDPSGDVISILAGAGMADRAGYTASRPLEAPVDTAWEYSTGTADVVAREVAERVGYGDEFTGWIESNLFEPLGITGADFQLDDTGVINGGSWVNMRPVDFARFGYLFLRGGEWDGEQIVPTEWVDYSRLPTPTADEAIYGAHWWVDTQDPQRFYASGFNGQRIMVVPEEDLMIVVLSRTSSGRPVFLVDRLEELFGAAESDDQST